MGRGKSARGPTCDRGLVGIKIVEGDVRTYELPSCEVVTLLDVLHYYDAAEQRALLLRCRDALVPDGLLLIREGDHALKGGAIWTRLVEKWATRTGFNRGLQVKFRAIDSLVHDLTSLGFSVHTEPVAGPLHPGNLLVIGKNGAKAAQKPAKILARATRAGARSTYTRGQRATSRWLTTSCPLRSMACRSSST